MPFDFKTGALIDSETLSQYIWGVADATTDLNPAMTQQTKLSVELQINAISSQIKRYISNDIIADDFVEVWDGAGSDELVPTMWPINSVSSVKFATNGDFASVSPLPTEAVFFDKTSIRLRSMRFPSGRGLVQVTYNAGYDEVPEDIKLAVILQFQYMLKKMGRGGDMVGLQSVSKGVGSGSESMTKDASLKPSGGSALSAGTSGMVSEATALLASYIRFEAPLSIMFARVS